MVRLLTNYEVKPPPHDDLITVPRTTSVLPYPSAYSRFVWLMKYALPLIAGVVLLLVIVWPEIKSKGKRFPVKLSNLNIETSGGQRVINARFTGVDSKNRPFSVTADTVLQEVEMKQEVELTQPKADITLASKSWVAIAAPSGVFRRNREELHLFGGVDLFHDAGYEFRTRKATIGLKNGKATSNTKVNGQGPFGTIEAQGFLVTDNGSRVLFTGKSRLVLYPKAPVLGNIR